MKSRSLALDLIRIISAFFVVFSHTTDIFVLFEPLKGSISWELIYYLNTLSRIAVALFIIVSGYLVLDKEKTQNLKTFYKKRFSRVFFPIIFWIPIYFLWAHFWGHVALTKEYVAKIIWIGDFWHLYFLVIIVELYLIAPFISKYLLGSIKKETLWFVILTAFSIFCATLILLPHQIDLRNNIITMFIPYIGVFYAGAYFRKLHFTNFQSVLLLLIYLGLGIITNFIAKGDMSSFIAHNYGPTLLFMSFAFFLALKSFTERLNNKVRRFAKIISQVSFATFGIYIIHYAVLDVVREYLHLYPWQIHSPIVFFAILPAIITFAVCAVLVLILRKISHLKYLIG